MSELQLHYVFDPLCGWCYGAAALVQQARRTAGVAVHLHAGVMLTRASRFVVGPQWRQRVLEADARIAAMCGVEFGVAYQQGLLGQDGLVLDSEPSTAAVLAAQELGADGLEMLSRLQIAYYQQGRNIMDAAVLCELAGECGLDVQAFAEARERIAAGEHLQAHARNTRELMARLGAQGFPSMAVETGEAQGEHLKMIELSPWLGRPEAFGAALAALASRQSEPQQR